MNLSIAVLAFVCVTNLLLGLLVLIRNPRSKTSLSFFGITMNVTCWSVANYFTEAAFTTVAPNRVFNRLAYFFALLAILSIVMYCLSFYRRKSKLVPYLLASFAVFVPLSLTDLVAGKVLLERGELHFVAGPLLSAYVVFVVVCLVYCVRRLRHAVRHASEVIKQQAKLILLGISFSIVGALLLSALIPLLADNYATAKFGPLTSVFLVYAIGYAIIKHGLFDIRLIVARSLAYILLVTAVFVFYGAAVFGLARNFVPEDNTLLRDEIIPVTLALLLAVSYQRLKKFLDKTTSKFFYQDAYDSQEFLDSLNKELVGTIELQRLLSRCADVIQQNLKSEYCLFALKETASEGQRIIGTSEKKFSHVDAEFARHATPHIVDKVIIADYLETDHKELHVRMQKNSIAVLVRLVENADDGSEGIGYIVLGQKKSGNPYNSQDRKVLEIIANELVIAIQNALRFEEIQNFNIKLQDEVKRATAQLQHTNEKLRQLDETKDDFISMASHQLRTPLTSVKGYLSMVLEGDVGKVSPRQEKLLNQAFISSERMVYLIADLLNVSRLRTGKFVIETKPTNLAEIIEGEVEQLVETAEARGLKLAYDKPKDFPTLMLDETKIRQVIMNFTDNAIHYTPSGGRITVALSETPYSVQFTVTDNGIGVPKHEQHHLFTKFYRAGNARKARPDGTGLGLFMAKKVIIAQGGSIIFKSHEGKGSTFGFTFAKAKLKLPTEKTEKAGDTAR